MTGTEPMNFFNQRMQEVKNFMQEHFNNLLCDQAHDWLSLFTSE
jgi:hypothetical protein